MSFCNSRTRSCTNWRRNILKSLFTLRIGRRYYPLLRSPLRLTADDLRCRSGSCCRSFLYWRRCSCYSASQLESEVAPFFSATDSIACPVVFFPRLGCIPADWEASAALFQGPDAADAAPASRPAGGVVLAGEHVASQDLVALAMPSNPWTVEIPASCSPSESVWG